jgi:hypothetical protein
VITEWFVNLGTSISGWLASLFPDLLLPPFVTDSLGGLYDFLSSASGLANWFPWAVLSAIVGALVTWFLGLFSIKLLLFIWARMPFVGGGA